jgi:hypothetical protein
MAPILGAICHQTTRRVTRHTPTAAASGAGYVETCAKRD